MAAAMTAALKMALKNIGSDAKEKRHGGGESRVWRIGVAFGVLAKRRISGISWQRQRRVSEETAAGSSQHGAKSSAAAATA
jgi:hypothetical protein